jgi:hypothetical protein
MTGTSGRELSDHVGQSLLLLRSLGLSGTVHIAARYQRLRWALILSWVLVTGLAVAIWAIFTLNKKAKRSQADLIRGYQLSWKIGMVAALAKVFLLIPLLAYGTFELVCY